MRTMKIALGADHGGMALKILVKDYLVKKRHEVADMGSKDYDPDDHYPTFAHKVASAVSKGEADMGLLFCTTGIGMSIAANRHKGVRCASCYSKDQVQKARKHNGINVLALGSMYIRKKDAEDMVDSFLRTEAKGGRHSRRRKMIDSPE